jgi:hypothetical protein
VVARFEKRKNRGVEIATIVRHALALGYEFVVTFKKMPPPKMAAALAASVRPARTPTKRSKPVAEKATTAARRKGPRSR